MVRLRGANQKRANLLARLSILSRRRSPRGLYKSRSVGRRGGEGVILHSWCRRSEFLVATRGAPAVGLVDLLKFSVLEEEACDSP